MATRRNYHRKGKGRGKSRKGQKLYIMKGCSKGVTRSYKKASRQNSLRRGRRQSVSLAGGNCTTCQVLNGGSTVSPLIGSPWSSTDGQTQQSSNHYAQNMYKEDPQMMMKVRGGRKRGALKGGALMNLIPADLLSLGRDLSFNANSAYSSLTGATQPVNPSVTEGHLKSSVNLSKIVV